MVVLYFSIRASEEKKITMREFSDYLKKTILGNDQRKVIGIDVMKIINKLILVSSNERINIKLVRFTFENK
jgi:hypothetical protein